MTRILTLILAIILLTIFSIYSESRIEPLFEFLSKFCVGLLVFLLLNRCIPLFKNFKLHLNTTFSRKQNKDIRVAFSYLIRIVIKGENNINQYLLVKNEKIGENSFQPPGGVYKYHSSDYIDSIGAKDDVNFHQKGDLRLTAKRKNIPTIINRFNDRTGREVSIEREFYEELIQPGILPYEKFPWLNYRFLKQVNSGFGYSEHFKVDEIKFFDIYEIILSEEQQAIIKKLLVKDSTEFVFASEDIIRRNGFDKTINKDSFRVLPHTINII